MSGKAAVTYIFGQNPPMMSWSQVKRVKDHLQGSMLDSKRRQRLSMPNTPVATLLAFESAPTYMLNKHSMTTTAPNDSLFSRWFTPEPSYLTSDQRARLTAEFRVPGCRNWDGKEIAGERQEEKARSFTTEIALEDCSNKKYMHSDCSTPIHSQRSMYFGPGQCILWATINLKATHFSNLMRVSGHDMRVAAARMTRRWGSLTEDILSKRHNLRTAKYQPGMGIWVQQSRVFEQKPRQIADLRLLDLDMEKGMATISVAVNVDVPATGPPEVNPWARLEKSEIRFHGATSLETEVGHNGYKHGSMLFLSVLFDLRSAILGALQLSKEEIDASKVLEDMDDCGGWQGPGFFIIPWGIFDIF